MKVYYLENDLYPATYTFANDAVGATGTSISWIDVAAGDDTTYSATIVASEDGHNKVIKFLAAGANGKYTNWRHNTTTNPTSGTVELHIKWKDLGQGLHYISFVSTAPSTIIETYYNSATNLFYALYGNGAGGNTTVNVAVTADTWTHLRYTFDCATDTYSLWVNGVILVNNQNFYNDRTVTALSYYFLQILGGGGINSLECYIDAIGESWDANYTIGDNLEVDWHYYNKNEITNIVEYPPVINRNNTYSKLNITISDFEGALYSSWYSRNFNKIMIEDEDENVLFRGFLIGKKFYFNSLVLTVASFGIALEWYPFYKNYILAEGKVRTVNANSILTMYNDLDEDDVYDGAGEDFTWVVDKWIIEQAVGLFIVDNTNDLDFETWTCSAISQANGTEVSGDEDSLDAPNDGDTYYCTDTDNINIIITPTMGGAGIDSTQYKLNKIIINYSIRIKNHYTGDAQQPHTYLQIWDGSEWVTKRDWKLFYNDTWYTKEGTVEIVEEDSVLQDYLTKTGDNYTSLTGIRIKCSSKAAGADLWIKVDYLTIDVYYYTHEISPIMEAITDSAASTITCAGVANWQHTGVCANDLFKIGQNTAQIAEDIASECKTPIQILGQDIPEESSGSEVIRPNADGATHEWDFTNSGGDGNHYKDLDEVVIDPNEGDENTIHYNMSDVEDSKTDIFQMGTFALPADTVVTSLDVHVYSMCNDAWAFIQVHIYIPSVGDWQVIGATCNNGAYAWNTITLSNLSLIQTDLDGLQVKFVCFLPFGEGKSVWVDLFYITVNYGIYNPFDKFIAQDFRGTFCIDALNAVCKLEGADWCEDHVNERIKLVKPTNYENGGITVTYDHYDYNFEYDDQCNQIRRVDVWGKKEYDIHEFAEDLTVEGNVHKQVVDERIVTSAQALEMAQSLLDNYKLKRPDIRIPLIGTYPTLQLGHYVEVVFTNPDIASVNYPIRSIERHKLGIDEIQTIIYAGLGESTKDEEVLMDSIRKTQSLALKVQSDKLVE